MARLVPAHVRLHLARADTAHDVRGAAQLAPIRRIIRCGETVDLNANLKEYLKEYLDGAPATGGRRPDARYASFDYCFNYFQSFRESGDLGGLANTENIQISCLQLGFYLASWGMLRGSAELLQKSARHFVPLIEAIASTESSLWEIDADRYTEANIAVLLDLARRLRLANGGMSDILVTKVMLGVFGSVPAFDTNFRRGFGAATFGAKALRKIGAFYQQNAELLDEYRVPRSISLQANPLGVCTRERKSSTWPFS